MHTINIQREGVPLNSAKKALIMIHGRGANAADILGLQNYLNVDGFALLAPEATNHTWYPLSFMAPVEANEPWLSSALELIQTTVAEAEAAGIPASSIHFLGFSQGACVALEYAARNGRRYGGIVAFTGGLIGHQIDLLNYQDELAGTPVFIGTSDPDPHVPVARVEASVEVLKDLGADVHVKIYPGMGHTINEDEITLANKLIFTA